MPIDPELKRAIEEVKLRAPIEEVVRELVGDLTKRGKLWEARCPFHEERTPSFKVDPARGTWRCYGACDAGGDVIHFLQEAQNLAFYDALELLAARTGVELPRRRRRREEGEEPALVALASTQAFFEAELRKGEGREALDYLTRRGFTDNTLRAFGLGYAPRAGRMLVEHLRREGGDPAVWERAGILRTSDDGQRYSFFRGRLTIPIRDVAGRTVGFGARRLGAGDEGGPKYINTAETPWFHKGRLIYALDRAIDAVRRGGHLILVEGYTDVMAAHQVGIPTVAAVLGTATTDDHAALVRRAGARRVSLVFDGDAAGRKAAWRALSGLLPLDVDLEVVTLPSGKDPADVLLEEGSEAFLALLEHGSDWFDFIAEGLAELRGRELARETDRALELLDRLPKPVLRDDRLAALAARLGMPTETLREAWRALPERRRAAYREAHEPPVEGLEREAAVAAPPDPRRLAAYETIAGALLVDPGLVPRARPWVARCPSPGLRHVLETVVALFGDDEAELDVGSVMTALGDHPARAHVLTLEDHARRADYPPHQLLDQNIELLGTLDAEEQKRSLRERVAELSARVDGGGDTGQAGDTGDDAAAREELERTLARLGELHRKGATPMGAGVGPDAGRSIEAIDTGISTGEHHAGAAGTG